MEWITGNFALDESQMQNNAKIIYSYLQPKGWTLNSIAGILGNMETESYINPGIWQDLKPYKLGYGLVQWTPYTKYSEWAGTGWENNGNKELDRIIWEFDNGQQYYKTTAYPLTASQFKTSTNSPEYLAYAFLYNYERPADKNQPQRKTDARKWYDYLSTVDPNNPDNPPVPPPDPPVPDPEPIPYYIPVWLLFKFRRGMKTWT